MRQQSSEEEYEHVQIMQLHELEDLDLIYFPTMWLEIVRLNELLVQVGERLLIE